MAKDKLSGERHNDWHREAEQYLGEHLRELVVAKLSEKAAAKQRRGSAKGRLQAEALEMIGERISGLDVWTRVPPGDRRARVSREELAGAAVRIADTEGFAALSMRRLAQEVGVGTMTLYHYVRDKDELLTLLTDSVMAEVVVPDDQPLPSDWRAAVSLIANRSKAAIERHPWVLDVSDDPPIGPNSVRHFDQTMQAVGSIDLPLADQVDIASTIDEFVFGYCLMERNNPGGAFDAKAEMVDYVSVLLETGAYPTLSALADEVGINRVWDTVRETLTAPDRFQRHLDRLLDGIAAQIARPS